ncbi:MAG: hypothetical protein GY940_26640 [bacterium]|nr:hypothetical protein [bacterium]
MNKSINSPVIGLDLGSSYVKAVALDAEGGIGEQFTVKTGYNYSTAVSGILTRFKHPSAHLGITGYGREQWQGIAHKTEIFALAAGMNHLGIDNATLVDIGGQDSKILKIVNGKLADHSLNRRCAAGTGSYLEFLAFRLDMDVAEMNQLASEEEGHHPLNSFCTVFSGTEILDCIKKKIPLPKLIRGMYVSIAERAREMTGMVPPVYLSGGVIAHHPLLKGIFQSVIGAEVLVVPDPQYLAALGIAAYAQDHQGDDV